MRVKASKLNRKAPLVRKRSSEPPHYLNPERERRLVEKQGRMREKEENIVSKQGKEMNRGISEC